MRINKYTVGALALTAAAAFTAQGCSTDSEFTPPENVVMTVTDQSFIDEAGWNGCDFAITVYVLDNGSLYGDSDNSGKISDAECSTEGLKQ